MENISNIYTAEIEKISLPSDNSAGICHAFSRALCKSPFVSLELRNVDPTLTKALLRNLPETVQRLSVVTTPPERSPRGSYTLPSIVNLRCLYLEYSVSSIEHMFDGVFQHLRKLSITDDTYFWEDREPCSWREGDVMALKRAVTEGRMPSLENLSIRHISLRGFGEHLVDTIQQPTVKIVDLVNANLGSEDGQHFAKRIDEGKLNHVETLTLLKNPELSSISQQLKPACYDHDINLEMDLPEGGPNVGLILATGSSKAEQTETTHLENPANEARGPQFDFSTIGNLVSTFLNSVRQPNPEEQIEDSLQNIEMSDGDPKRTDYVDDLDLD